MMNQFKNNYGWGILIFLLWGFFFLFIKVPAISGTNIQVIAAMAYALIIGFVLFSLHKWVFPKLNPFSITNQFILKSFFYATGALIGYLIVFISQLLILTPQQELVDKFSYGLFRSLTVLFTTPLSSDSYTSVIPQNVISTFSAFSVLLAMIALISIVLGYVNTRWKQMKTEKGLQEARLKILEMQMQPHFLFNSLNTIVSVIRSQPAKAEQLLLNLSDFLRFNFDSANQDLVELKSEIEFTENYLKLMKARFDSKLEWQISVDDLCKDNKIPVMTLQPFVENALKYGIDESKNYVSISINCFREKRFCSIEIIDNGPGIDFTKFKTFPVPGHSVENIKQRLELHYSKTDLLQIASQPGKGTKIKITIPDNYQRVG